MKHLITTTFLLFFGWTLGFSQAYVPFPTDSTVWKEGWVQNDGGSGSYTSGTNFYYLLGDTIVDGKIYSKLYLGSSSFSPNGMLQGFIREEQKVIYYYQVAEIYGFQGETIMYDFNLEVGDTMYWNFQVFQYGYDYAVVSQIDSIQIATGEYRKHYFYDTFWNGEWANAIEGIGSTYGLLFPNHEGFTLDYYNNLGCVATPQNLIYPNASWIDSVEQCLEVPVSTEETLQNSLKIFPNPTNSIVHLSETIYQAQVQVFSATGQKVLSTNDFTGSTIDLKDLPSGLYLLLISGDEEYAVRIIKGK